MTAASVQTANNTASNQAANAGALGALHADKPGAEVILTPVVPMKIAPRVAHSLLVSGIVQAGMGFKTAIVTEVAVCLTVFAQFRGTNSPAKKELFRVYKEAGYQCEVGGNGKDYKTVSRRMGYAADLYNSLPAGTVEEWMGDETHDAAAFAAVVNHLTVEYNFRSMSDVLTAAGKPIAIRHAKKAPAAQGPQPGQEDSKPEGEGGGNASSGPQAQGPQGSGGGSAPQEPAKTPTATDQKVINAAKKRVDAGDIPTERQSAIMAKYNISFDKQPDAGDQKVIEAMQKAEQQREADSRQRREQDSDKWVNLTYEGATLVLPKDMSRERLGDLGMMLMKLSHNMKGDKIDAKMLAEAFEAVAH